MFSYVLRLVFLLISFFCGCLANQLKSLARDRNAICADADKYGALNGRTERKLLKNIDRKSVNAYVCLCACA